MSYDASGTSWQPEENYVPMLGGAHGKTMWMFSGNLFLRYTNQDIFNQGSRGDKMFDAPNWIMGGLRRSSGKHGLFSVMTMFSADPLTEGSSGYPLLLQTGETNNGEPLVDRQHPHDLWMALGANYTYAISRYVDVSATAGYPFEPALGPPAFMHRLSAFHLPDAPLSHHWQDATHITYGVGTLGLRIHRVKLEGSIFNGREPDEHRYDFDSLRLDSYSFRFSWNPVHTLSLQVSRGFLKSPELLHADEDITRTTFSVLHTRRIDPGYFISSAFVVGVNDPTRSPRTRSLLLETNLALLPITIYGRYEFVQKAANELALINTEVAPVYDNHSFTLGINKHLMMVGAFQLSAGLQGAYLLPDTRLQSIYGTNPLSAEVYLQFAPPFMMH